MDEVESPVAQVLAMHLVVLKILYFVRTPELLHNCRLVCWRWKKCSTTLLQSRKNIHVPFRFENAGVERQGFYLHRITAPPLSEFTEFLEKTEADSKLSVTFKEQDEERDVWSFPCVNFSFCGPVEAPDARTFFDLFGSHVKRLRLYGQTVMCVDAKSYHNLIFGCLPNLEELTFVDLSWNIRAPCTIEVSHHQFNDPLTVTLPHLKVFKVQGDESRCPELVQEIVQAAPNLQQFLVRVTSGQFEYPVMTSYNDGSPLFLEELKTFFNEYGRTNLDKFLKVKPRVRSFQVMDFDLPHSHGDLYLREEGQGPDADEKKRIRSFLSKILVSSVETLTRLKVELPMTLANLTWAQNWPVLEKVKILDFCVSYWGNPHLFQIQWPLTMFSKFPNLNTLILSTLPYTDVLPFPFDLQVTDKGQKLENVRKLVIFHGCTSQWMTNFTGFLPNLEVLELKDIDNFPQFGAAIWKFGRLTQLTLEINLTSHNLCPDMDSVFTGFSLEFCATLLHDLDSMEIDLNPESGLRGQGSMVDLKNLQSLDIKIKIPGSDGTFRSSSAFAIISPVTGKFAFEMTPSLQSIGIFVQLSWNLNETRLNWDRCAEHLKGLQASLIGLKPYVSILRLT